ncbi:ANK-REP-REGION domain-containing protein [Mycena venus]|uniref:ANK-REP-REGION domain-containing protein n=1 Tax=Mycena venus TaxID=2733690 RepID=A0A8H6Y014_9AGAR|nr:ANK-REP-REGION domain-containing protein [Mycena venus]
MSSPDSVPSIDIGSTYGALLIGVYFAIFFQGILTVQAYIYYDSFPDDSRGMKVLVAIVWLFDFVHLVLICQTEYHYLVTNWGNQQALLETTIPLDLHLILLTLASLTCQAFFLNRVWKFSRNLFMTAFLGAACLSTGIIDIVIATQTVRGKSVETILSHIFQAEVIAVFTVGAAADMAIAMILVWYLRREMSSFERIKSLVTRLIQYTIATGLVTSLLALGCLVAYVLSLDSLIFLAMHFSLGRMYTNALLATLNSRRTMRARLALQPEIRWTATSGMPSAPQFAAQPEVTQDFAMKSVDEQETSKSSQGGFDSVEAMRLHSTV